MPWPKISRGVRLAVVDRLSNVINGFTPNLLLAIADAGIAVPDGWTLPIDFGVESLNFFQADIDPHDLDDTTPTTFPAMTVYSDRSANTNDEKFRLFAGPVTIHVRMFVSWTSSAALPDFETIGDCVEEAFYQTFNSSDPAVVAWACTDQFAYNGELAFARGKLSQDGESWFQDYGVSIAVDAYANSAS